MPVVLPPLQVPANCSFNSRSELMKERFLPNGKLQQPVSANLNAPESFKSFQAILSLPLTALYSVFKNPCEIARMLEIGRCGQILDIYTHLMRQIAYQQSVNSKAMRSVITHLRNEPESQATTALPLLSIII
jgi:hypothetical protein